MSRAETIRALRRNRPRSYFVRGSLLAFLLLLAGSWIALGPALPDVLGARGMQRLERFWDREMCPAPVRGTAWDTGAVLDWAAGLWEERGAESVQITLWMSVLAIVLAWFTSLVTSLPAARTIAAAEPFAPSGGTSGAGTHRRWRLVVAASRAFLVLLRSLPVFILAYILIQTFGYSPWPAVLALAIHNAGILGRLNAEVIENLPPKPMRALRAAGASRPELIVVGVFPAAINRFLLYFFYRWETCVRHATVVGMLGVVSLGYWIEDARHAGKEDVMIFYILLGSALVLAGDLVSAGARALVRRAS